MRTGLIACAGWMACAALAWVAVGTIPRATAAAGLTELAVGGRSNATPWVAARGSFVAVAWGATADRGAPDVFLAVSRDGGATFGPPVRVNPVEGEARTGGELPPRVELAQAGAGRDPVIVVAYETTGAATAVKVARSTDGGRTFQAATTLQSPAAAGDRGWHAMTLDTTGAAHVMWLDHRGLAAQKSMAADHHEDAAMDGAAMAQLSGLYYAREGGNAAAGERELVKGVCYCCKVAMAAGADGSLFAAWRHVYAGNIRDIAFIASRDGGRTFEPPTRVSDDQWQLAGCPDDGPAMAIDSRGTVHVVWPTVVGGAQPEGAIFYASSKDGRTFTVRQRIPTPDSRKSSHPQIAIDGSGRITVAWDELVSGKRQAHVRTASLDAGGAATFGPASTLGGDAPSMYPVLASMGDRLIAVWTRGAPGAQTIAVQALVPGGSSNR
jgi:hypothetical protein